MAQSQRRPAERRANDEHVTAGSASGESSVGGADGGVGAASGGTELSGTDAEAVGRLRGFAASHGGDAVAVIEHLGRVGARIVVIAPDGEFGDQMVSSVDAAGKVCQRAGLTVREWDRELTALVTMTPADRRRMAGRAR